MAQAGAARGGRSRFAERAVICVTVTHERHAVGRLMDVRRELGDRVVFRVDDVLEDDHVPPGDALRFLE